MNCILKLRLGTCKEKILNLILFSYISQDKLWIMSILIFWNIALCSTYLEEDFVWKMLIQMTSALKECHRRKNGKAVLHRDLKPANIFLDSDNNVKLGDFGLARVLHHETSFAKTFVGTPYYMSPVSSIK